MTRIRSLKSAIPFFLLALLFGLPQNSATAAAPPPARIWFAFQIDGVEQVQAQICADGACERIRSTYQFDGCSHFRCGGNPFALLDSDSFGCLDGICALDKTTDADEFYRLVVRAHGQTVQSDVMPITRWQNDETGWQVTSANDQLLLTPDPDPYTISSQPPLWNFWGVDLIGFILRWVGVAILEMLLLYMVIKRMGLTEQIYGGSLLHLLVWTNLILYLPLALFFGSLRPLVWGGARYWGYGSLVFGVILLRACLNITGSEPNGRAVSTNKLGGSK